MIKVKLTHVGSSLGIELPSEVLGKLNAGHGDYLFLVEVPHGYILTANDTEVDEQVTTALGIMKRYENALRKLAK